MFKTILSEQWKLLSPAVQQHYGIEDGEKITMQGELAVRHGKFIKMLMPFIRLTGALVPVEGDKFTVTVENKRVGDTFYWHRLFEKDNKVYEFDSKMERYGDDVVEFVGLGIGIKMGLKVSDGGVLYIDKGYVFKLGSKLIPVPIGMLVGKSVIEEFTSESSSNDLEMRFVVNHPWFGFGFSYMGFFNFKNDCS